MTNRAAVIVFTATTLLMGNRADAQMFKCTDAAKKVTYSNVPCKQQGLNEAGQVQDRIQVTPALQPPPARARSAAEQPVVQKPAAEEEKKPERRCFTVKTAKGTTTRCNDKPDEQ
jgi:hypothetical protein